MTTHARGSEEAKQNVTISELLPTNHVLFGIPGHRIIKRKSRRDPTLESVQSRRLTLQPALRITEVPFI
jgi:hypothetical protein